MVIARDSVSQFSQIELYLSDSWNISYNYILYLYSNNEEAGKKRSHGLYVMRCVFKSAHGRLFVDKIVNSDGVS